MNMNLHVESQQNLAKTQFTICLQPMQRLTPKLATHKA